jgi:transposase
LGVAQAATLWHVVDDLEQVRVIDLLPDRSARGFAAWLGGQGDVEIISRDRCGLYADGARQGAPAARQITDRHHLVTNLAEALERDVQRLQIEARTERGVARAPMSRGPCGRR